MLFAAERPPVSPSIAQTCFSGQKSSRHVCQGLSWHPDTHAAGAVELTNVLWIKGEFNSNSLHTFVLPRPQQFTDQRTLRKTLRPILLTVPMRRCCEGPVNLYTGSWGPCHATASGAHHPSPEAPKSMGALTIAGTKISP